MPRRIIAIGDIHGCHLALDALLQAIAPRPRDLIVALGDYVDRGPDSRGVLERLIELSRQCQLVPLIGNHEIMMLAAREEPAQLEFWLQFGGIETMASYGAALDQFELIPARHIEFIQTCHSHFETDHHIFLHANYCAEIPLERQREYTIFWEHLSTHTPEPHISGKTAVLGHTPQFQGEILDLGHLVCIDTYCVGGGWLTALEVNTRQIWQADQTGRLRE